MKLQTLLTGLGSSICLLTVILAQPVTPEEDDVRRVRQLFGSIGQSVVSFHAEYTIDKHPFDESIFPGGNIENAVAKTPGADEDSAAKLWFETLRQTHSRDESLDVLDSGFLCRENGYALGDKDRKKLLKHEISSYDGLQNYSCLPAEAIGTIANDEFGRMIPQNPVSGYLASMQIIGNVDRYKLLDCSPADTKGAPAAQDGSCWRLRLVDKETPPGEARVHEFIIDPTTANVLRRREYLGSSEEQLTIQQQHAFEGFREFSVGNSLAVLPCTVVEESMCFSQVEGNEVFGQKVVMTLTGVGPCQYTSLTDFSFPFSAGMKVWIKDVGIEYLARSDGRPGADDSALKLLAELMGATPAKAAEDGAPAKREQTDTTAAPEYDEGAGRAGDAPSAHTVAQGSSLKGTLLLGAGLAVAVLVVVCVLAGSKRKRASSP